MKLDILKEEYRKLADEKEQFKREKQYHAWEEQKREQKKERKAYESESTLTMKPELFFRGVGNPPNLCIENHQIRACKDKGKIISKISKQIPPFIPRTKGACLIFVTHI